ncbi:MAG: Lipid biosynthesis acyltransferase [Pedosphaera sp.]|nr:Lipid biosynthesis acyltransferase [Pedosphaera sp.]
MNNGAKEPKASSPTPKGLARLVASIYFRFYLMVLRCLSQWNNPRALCFSRLINPLFTFPLRQQRRKNLALLFPDSEQTPTQRRQLEKKHLSYLAFVRVEMAHIFLRMTPQQVKQKSTVSGMEHLETALKQGKGVLLIEGHFGHWNCTAALLAALGYPVTVVVNPDPIPGANLKSLHEQGARTMGAKVAFVGQDAYSSAKETFRNNGIFYLNIDVPVRTKHCQWFPFGNAAIQIDPGPAIMALRHRVPVIFAHNLLSETGANITLLPAANAAESATRPAPESLLQNWLEMFYEVVRQHPAQWWALNYINLSNSSVLQRRELNLASPAVNA